MGPSFVRFCGRPPGVSWRVDKGRYFLEGFQHPASGHINVNGPDEIEKVKEIQSAKLVGNSKLSNLLIFYFFIIFLICCV